MAKEQELAVNLVRAVNEAARHFKFDDLITRSEMFLRNHDGVDDWLKDILGAMK